MLFDSPEQVPVVQQQLPADPDPFEQLSPQLFVDAFHKLPLAAIKSGKPFWKTFLKWDKLSIEQRNKTVLFWRHNIVEEARVGILDGVRAALGQQVVEERARQVITTKHDKGRLVHMRVESDAAADWTEALREKTRPQLDAKDQYPEADPWNRIAEKFNNYEKYAYKNAVVAPNRYDALGLPMANPGSGKSLLNSAE